MNNQRLEVTVVYQRPAPPPNAARAAHRLFAWGSFVFSEFFLRGGQNSATRAAAFEILEAYHNALANLDESSFRAKVLAFVDKLELVRDARGHDVADGSALARLCEFEKQLEAKYPMPRVVVRGVKSEPRGSGTRTNVQ